MATYDDNVNEDEFLAHSSGASNNAPFEKGDLLGSKWRSKDGPGHIDTWLYTRLGPLPLWRHAWRQVKVLEDKETHRQKKVIWSENIVCYEVDWAKKGDVVDEVLKNRRRNEDGTRQLPFRHCPICRLIDRVRLLVNDGKLDWTAPVFKFSTGDEKDIVLHAGGIYGGYQKADRRQMEELNDAGIFLRDAWQENISAKLSYLYIVAEHPNPKQLQIAIETSLLGDKIKKVIQKRKMATSDEKGSPFRNPYCIRWLYDGTAKKFDEKYDAMWMEDIRLDDHPQVKKLIYSNEGPDISRFFDRMDLKTLRAKMEQHASKSLKAAIDWNEIFDVVPVGEEYPKAARKSGSKPKVTPSQVAAAQTAAAEPTEPSVAGRRRVKKEPAKIPCDECGAPMLPTDSKCGKCGAEYEVDGSELPAEESEPKVAAAPMVKNGATAKPKPAPVDDEFGGGGDDDEDSLPF